MLKAITLLMGTIIALQLACGREVDTSPAPIVSGSDKVKKEEDNQTTETNSTSPTKKVTKSRTSPEKNRKKKRENDETKTSEVESGSTGCLEVSTSNSNFKNKGTYKFETKRRSGFTFYLPKTDGCKSPVIAFAMGTAAPEMSYIPWYVHFASHGFAVAVDPNMGAIAGDSLKRSIDQAYQNFGSQLSPKAATIGHSQGGAGALNARGHKKVDTVVGIQPGQFPSGGNNNINYLGLAGSADMFGTFTDPMLFHYNQITGPKFYAKLAGADHISTPTILGGNRTTPYLAISTAWFSCHLDNNQNSCNLFKVGNCGKFPGRWARCEGKMQ